jgi:hypothetical protein
MACQAAELPQIVDQPHLFEAPSFGSPRFTAAEVHKLCKNGILPNK